MRPATLDEVVGQAHLLGPGAPLRRLVEGGAPSSMLLYGPPGTGKTTLAMLVAGATGRRFAQLSALSAGVKEVRAVIADARAALRATGEQTVLFIDEVHRFSRTQQDSLLGAVEDRTIILIAATTENPFFSVVSPLLSRSLVLQLQPLTDDEIARAAGPRGGRRARAGRPVHAGRRRQDAPGRVGRRGRPTRADRAEEAAGAVQSLADADRAADPTGADPVRSTWPPSSGRSNRAAVRYDRAGDQHYDVTSAFIKSIRGCDVDAALHYLARMIEAGEDPRFIARRLMIHASEDVGMADPTALPVAVAAAQVVQLVGLPEARIALAQATIHLATAPKSNAVMTAIDAAMADVRAGKAGSVPPAPARRPLPGGGTAGQRAELHLPARPAGGDCRAAVSAGRTGRSRLLPADRPRRGTRGRGAGAERLRRAVRGDGVSGRHGQARTREAGAR